jgi:hypothetical protein
MRFLGDRRLSVLLIGALLFCHGVFGALHLACYSPRCAGGGGHPAEHRATSGAVDDAHEHPADHGIGHGTGGGYFAVLAVGLLGLFLGVLPKRASSRIGLEARWYLVLRRVPAVFRPPPTPKPFTLQVFRL